MYAGGSNVKSQGFPQQRLGERSHARSDLVGYGCCCCGPLSSTGTIPLTAHAISFVRIYSRQGFQATPSEFFGRVIVPARLIQPELKLMQHFISASTACRRWESPYRVFACVKRVIRQLAA